MIGLISCSAAKLDRPAAARELYTSQLFTKSLAYALRRCSDVYVLSAKHHLLPLSTVVTPYDIELAALDAHERRDWAREVAFSLEVLHADNTKPTRPLHHVELLVLAGEVYSNPLISELVTWHGVNIERIAQPLHGLQIGQRLSFLARELALVEEVAPVREAVSTE